MDRRKFIKKTAAAAASVAAMSALPESIRRAFAIPAASQQGTIADVEHIVVLMMENRSFEQYLGTLAGVRGFNDRHTLPIDGQPSVWQQPDGKGGYVMPFHLDSKTTKAQAMKSLPHGWLDGHQMWNHGRWDNWVPAKGSLTMGYFTRQDLPFHFALADAFTVCDAYFSSCMGPTNTNRSHLMTGMIDVAGTAGGPLLDNSPTNGVPLTWTTYPERLQAAGVSWQIYQGVTGNEPFKTSATVPTVQGDIDNPISPFNVLKFFPAFSQSAAGSALAQRGWSIRTYAQFAADIAAGSLPQISWLLPPALCSEHPVYTPADGATYIAAILDALTANPAVWSKTALFITYDENDGFFDHVVPPTPPENASYGLSNVDTTGEVYGGNAKHPAGPVGPGPRVPMFVVSPWSRGAWTCSQVFDHTSVIRFMEQRFGVMEPNISAWRRAVCGDLTSAFDFANPDASAITVSSVTGLSAAADAQSTLPMPVVPASQQQPVQEVGVRNARALPYELFVEASDDPNSGGIALTFVNTGSVAAVFQVYAAGATSSVKRYTVAAKSRLSDSWARQAAGAGQAVYDLTVTGPNGFLRRFVSGGSTVAQQGVSACYEVSQGDLRFTLMNGGSAPCTFSLVDNRYGAAAQHVTVAAGATVQQDWSLAASHRWYDVSVSSSVDPGFLRLFAGYVETGGAGVTDPAM
ncbi:Non-hemolytic phospholipase C [Burkholderia glumae]|uniref:phosphocholine-specific phospholipase C n=1 Tax=Burkholderia glumae TaxID=337 RepID=UPI0013742244|nr:phospholipase C, phosphocholine-specific [Burkholderia glumae]MCR1770796.1 phospholipase C, phosphocholine-specific [Burkholderia glumae]QHP93288.1 phospholipase C, phosphocholine-specific [Burkholderia glumae]QKM50901.1 Non-hemolytic phospholipase C [Burkholderia glumae]